jgi:hypothetical protein
MDLPMRPFLIRIVLGGLLLSIGCAPADRPENKPQEDEATRLWNEHLRVVQALFDERAKTLSEYGYRLELKDVKTTLDADSARTLRRATLSFTHVDEFENITSSEPITAHYVFADGRWKLERVKVSKATHAARPNADKSRLADLEELSEENELIADEQPLNELVKWLSGRK